MCPLQQRGICLLTVMLQKEILILDYGKLHKKCIKQTAFKHLIQDKYFHHSQIKYSDR